MAGLWLALLHCRLLDCVHSQTLCIKKANFVELIIEIKSDNQKFVILRSRSCAKTTLGK